jgi:hypothetical protein
MTLTNRSAKIALATLALTSSASLFAGLWGFGQHAANRAPNALAAVTQPATHPVPRAAAADASDVLIGLATQNIATVIL